MTTAQRAALRLRTDHGLTTPPTTDELLALCRDAGAEVDLAADLRGRVREVYAEGTIHVRAGQPRVWQRWLIAHGLAHHVLDPGANHLYLAERDDRFWVNKHERAAEIFAGSLLIGPLGAPVPGVEDQLDLAAWADVPFACTVRWLRMVLRPPSLVSLDRMDVDYEAAQQAAPTGEYRERIWSGLLAAFFAGLSLMHFDLDGDGAVQLLRAAMHVSWTLA